MARKKKNEFSMINGVRKTKSGTFQAAVYVGTSASEVDKNNKPKKIYGYITCDTEKECKEKARELKTDLANKSHSSYGNWTFEAWCKKWMEVNFVDYSQPNILDKLKPKYKPSTQKSYKMYIEHHFILFFGTRKLKDISEMHIKEYLAKKMKDGGKKGEPLSSTTIAKHFYILSDILYDALKIKNPCRDIEPPAVKKYKPRVLTEEEFNLFRDALAETWDEGPLLLAGWSGIRQGEIFCLKWGDIDKDKSEITIDENRAISEFGYMDVDPKSERGFRTIPVPEETMNLIETRRLSQGKISPYIFPLRPDSYSERFSNIIEYHNELFDLKKKFGQAGIDNYLKFHAKNSIKRNLHIQNKKLPDIRFHDLRHYCASMFYENKIPDQYAADFFGHDIKVLKTIYQHLYDSARKENDAKVKGLFK